MHLFETNFPRQKPPQQQEIVGSQHERTPVPGFTAAQMASFRKKIKEEKSMKCPFQVRPGGFLFDPQFVNCPAVANLACG